MKKIIVSLAALAALSTAALAERNYDISSPPYGETQLMDHKASAADVSLFAAPQFVTVKKNNYDNNVRDNIGRTR